MIVRYKTKIETGIAFKLFQLKAIPVFDKTTQILGMFVNLKRVT